MLENLKERSLELMKDQNFDTLGISLIDFKKQSFNSFEIHEKKQIENRNCFFDLASLTKSLTLGSYYLLNENVFSDDMKLLLDHRGGIPSWERLSKKNWKESILSYEVKKSNFCYSDLSAIRLMLEIEKKTKENFFNLCSFYWDKELLFWKDLSPEVFSLSTGFRGGEEIKGIVHDDNAFVIDEFLPHAGIFSTLKGLSQSLLNLNEKANLIKKTKNLLKALSKREYYCFGWEIPSGEKTLAGNLCSKNTIGHLGFTGTSMWIDLERERGAVILSNASFPYSHDREGLNFLRREINNLIWTL